jgi:hypothetical protein
MPADRVIAICTVAVVLTHCAMTIMGLPMPEGIQLLESATLGHWLGQKSAAKQFDAMLRKGAA